MNPTGRSWTVRRQRLQVDPDRAAPDLLGAQLVSDLDSRVVVRITEVEAYAGHGQDPGSHAHRGRTPRNAAMFGPVGHAYVYLSHGIHWCLNVVAHMPDCAGAVLIRAGEVTSGQVAARARRLSARTDRDLARGPARLAACLGVSGVQDGIDLLDPLGPLRLELADTRTGDAAEPGHALGCSSGPRTGVAGAGSATPWRFWLPGEPTVSPYRPARPRRGT